MGLQDVSGRLGDRTRATGIRFGLRDRFSTATRHDVSSVSVVDQTGRRMLRGGLPMPSGLCRVGRSQTRKKFRKKLTAKTFDVKLAALDLRQKAVL
jgi:hypothetical protein